MKPRLDHAGAKQCVWGYPSSHLLNGFRSLDAFFGFATYKIFFNPARVDASFLRNEKDAIVVSGPRIQSAILLMPGLVMGNGCQIVNPADTGYSGGRRKEISIHPFSQEYERSVALMGKVLGQTDFVGPLVNGALTFHTKKDSARATTSSKPFVLFFLLPIILILSQMTPQAIGPPTMTCITSGSPQPRPLANSSTPKALLGTRIVSGIPSHQFNLNLFQFPSTTLRIFLKDSVMAGVTLMDSKKSLCSGMALRTYQINLWSPLALLHLTLSLLWGGIRVRGFSPSI